MFEIPTWLVQKLDETDNHIKRICRSETPQMQQMLDYVLSVKGKQIRPMMTFLCSRLTGKKPNVAELAAVVEICHIASLVHDDIIDDGVLRRGHESLQKKFGKEMAVYCGDYMIFAAISRTKLVNKLWYRKVFNKLEFMCNCEIEQYHCRYDLNVSEQEYIEYMQNKTSALFEIACLTGAREARMNRHQLHLVESFATNFGIMFQLVDDLSDWLSSENVVKKKTQADFSEGYYTLPVIFTMRNNEYSGIISKLAEKCRYDKALNETDRNELTSCISQAGGFEYTYKMIDYYKYRSYESLSEFMNSPYKDLLKTITDHISASV